VRVILPTLPFALDFRNDGALLACGTGSDERASPTLRVLATGGGGLVTSFMQPGFESCQGVAFVASGQELVFVMVDESGSSTLWRARLDARDPIALHTYGGSAPPPAIVRARAGARFAVVGEQAEVWDAQTGKILRSFAAARPGEPMHAAFSADGARLYVYGTEAGAVVRYDLDRGDTSGRWAAPTAAGAQVLVTPDERFLVAVGESFQGVFVHDLVTGIQRTTDASGTLALAERTLCTPWVTDPTSSLLCCLKLAPWCFRLPDLDHIPPAKDLIAGGARCLAAAWAWESPLVAFGTLEDASVRWLRLEPSGSPPVRE
jgi:hypothetical protein